jgi:hypothetical protein
LASTGPFFILGVACTSASSVCNTLPRRANEFPHRTGSIPGDLGVIRRAVSLESGGRFEFKWK